MNPFLCPQFHYHSVKVRVAIDADLPPIELAFPRHPATVG